jgi:hypothetical protein
LTAHKKFQWREKIDFEAPGKIAFFFHQIVKEFARDSETFTVPIKSNWAFFSVWYLKHIWVCFIFHNIDIQLKYDFFKKTRGKNRNTINILGVYPSDT